MDCLYSYNTCGRRDIKPNRFICINAIRFWASNNCTRNTTGKYLGISVRMINEIIKLAPIDFSNAKRKKPVLSEESALSKSKKCREAAIRTHNNRTEMEERLVAEKISNSWNKLNEEERRVRCDNISAGRQKTEGPDRVKHFQESMKNRSEEEKKIPSEKISTNTKKRWDNKTEDEKIKALQPMRDGYRNWQENMSDEEREERGKAQSERNRIRWANMPKEDKSRLCSKIWGNKPVYTNNSTPNRKFADILDSYGIQYQREFTLKNESSFYRYDFKVGRFLIEINPIITHNIHTNPWTNPIDKSYHHNKSITAYNNGYQCIHVWDWDNIDRIIQLLIPMPRIYARKTICREVPINEAKEFCKNNHIQGWARADICLGLYKEVKSDNLFVDKELELVSIMTFGKPRYNKKFEYELIRYCSTHHVVGGAEKLWKHFIDEYNPTSIISYCDFNKFTGRTYEKLGMKIQTHRDKVSGSIHWFNPARDTKAHITDNFLRQRGFDQLLGEEYGCFGKGTDNNELMIQHGYLPLVDSGQLRFDWEK